MKKVVSLLCVFALALSLASCGGKGGPEKVVAEFCDAMQSFDLEKMASCTVNGDAGDDALEDESVADFMDLIKKSAKDIRYTIGEVAENGDSATVAVDITYPDLAPVVTSAMGDFFAEAMGLALTNPDATEEEVMDLLIDILDKALKDSDNETVDVSTEFLCVKSGDEWKIDDVSSDLLNVITCNFFSAMEDLDF